MNPKNATFIPNALETMAMGSVIVKMTVRTLITSLDWFDTRVAWTSIRLPTISRYASSVSKTLIMWSWTSRR